MRWIVGLLAAAALSLAIVLALLPEALIQPRRKSRAAMAIGSMNTLTRAQSLYREGNRGQNDPSDPVCFAYADSLTELGRVTLIDPILASGQKAGYSFRMTRSPENPEFLWLATASPSAQVPKEQRRFFAVNQSGVVHYDTIPIPLRADCQIWSRARPVGK